MITYATGYNTQGTAGRGAAIRMGADRSRSEGIWGQETKRITSNHC